jgi:hypothetical protein
MTLVALDSAHHRVMGSPIDMDVSRVMPLAYVVVVFDDRIVDHGRRIVVVDDGGSVDVGDPHRAVVVDPVEMAVVDDDGVVQIAVASNIDAHLGNRVHQDGADPPVIVRIIRLSGCQGDPAHIIVPVDPAHAARTPVVVLIPVVAHPGRSTTHPGRAPVPAAAAVDAHPVAMVMGHVAERLVGNPTVVPVVYGPSARRERSPACAYAGGLPQGSVFAVVIDLLPATVFLEGVGILLQIGRKIFDGIPFDLHALGPEIVPSQIPVVPVAIDLAVCGHNLVGIGDDR